MIDRLRFLPYLEGLVLLIIGEREGRAARKEAEARPEIEAARVAAAA